jgi:hypothetical protein
MADQYVEKHWREVNSRTKCGGEDFGKGIKDFKFSVGQGYGFIPAQSYFRVELKLWGKQLDATEFASPKGEDHITFADNVCGNLWNNIYFNMGGQTVSYLSNGVPQCDILKSRLTKNPLYNKSIGVAQGLGGHFIERVSQMFPIGDDVHKDLNKYTVSRSQRNFIWQPSLGIFEYSLPMGAGEYEFQLNPSTDYATACVDSGLYEQTFGHVEVIDVRFYACMCRVNLEASGKEEIHLMEMEVMNYTMDGKGVNIPINQEFTVPSSTRAITMFIQDQSAGKKRSVPPSRFTNAYPYTSNALSMHDYQIEYANMTKPTIRIDSDYSDYSNTMYQRYISTALESGQFFNLTGCETFEEWCERGPIFHETFIKSADNLATRLHVVANYSRIDVVSRLFIVAHYSRTIKIIRQNGLVVSVTSSSV